MRRLLRNALAGLVVAASVPAGGNFLFTGSVAQAADAAPLTGAELKALLTGAVISGKGLSRPYTAHHHADGTVSARSGSASSTGHWTVEGDAVKTVWDNARWTSGAWRFVKQPDGSYNIVVAYFDGNGTGAHDTNYAGRVDVSHATIARE